MRQLCNAVKYLHTLSPQPIAHRDIKPDNVLITAIPEGSDNGTGPDDLITVKLCDFGTSRAAGTSKTRSMMKVLNCKTFTFAQNCHFHHHE